tara:strand:- start:505 stop:687 length:183 start_codon:yes stop_codon:yes gene_type:complete
VTIESTHIVYALKMTKNHRNLTKCTKIISLDVGQREILTLGYSQYEWIDHSTANHNRVFK